MVWNYRRFGMFCGRIFLPAVGNYGLDKSIIRYVLLLEYVYPKYYHCII